ncbi:hypothetical protein RJT34_12220 [Clitoria ternatea]|uniref:Uncharacterized protein n=1 Tax=Clitoria ternatea TaxID=43366 RepID=A0AAN9JP36_CLITE
MKKQSNEVTREKHSRTQQRGEEIVQTKRWWCGGGARWLRAVGAVGARWLRAVGARWLRAVVAQWLRGGRGGGAVFTWWWCGGRAVYVGWGKMMLLGWAIVQNFPSMLKGLEKQFQMLLEHITPVNDKLIEVMAKAASHVFFSLSDIYPFLERMCLDGTRRQAKFAVSAIAALSSEQPVFLKLYEGLIDSLYSQRNVPTILQSLGCVAQYSVSTFETHNEEITSFICQKIIQMEHLDDGHGATSFHDTSQSSKSCQLKIYGLKALVKCSLPYQGSHVKYNINGLLDILSKMLRESDHFVNKDMDSCENDKDHIRLAAAKGILRLARKWDLNITPEIFRLVILIVKDSSSFVRSTFLSKTQKLLKEHRLPIRFACAFALAVTDGIGDLQYLVWISLLSSP